MGLYRKWLCSSHLREGKSLRPWPVGSVSCSIVGLTAACGQSVARCVYRESGVHYPRTQLFSYHATVWSSAEAKSTSMSPSLSISTAYT